MNTVSMHRKYSVYSIYLDTMLEHSVEIGEGESKLDAYRRGLKELDQIAADLRKEANPHQDGWKPGSDFPDHMKTEITFGPPPVIDLNQERMEIAIDNCQTEDELKQWKEANPVIPVPILKHYNERLKQLSNGNKD